MWVVQTVKNSPTVQEAWVRFLGQEDPLEKEMAIQLQYSCLENPMDRGAWWATVHGVARVGHDLSTKPPPPFYTIPKMGGPKRDLIVEVRMCRMAD